MMAEDNEQRKRTIQKHTRLNLREEQALRLRMAMAGNPRFNSFSIQSLLASQIIHIDFTDTKQLIEQMARIGKGSQHFFGQFAKRLFVKLGHTRKAMLLVQDSLSVLVPLRGCKRSRCKRRLALSDH